MTTSLTGAKSTLWREGGGEWVCWCVLRRPEVSWGERRGERSNTHVWGGQWAAWQAEQKPHPQRHTVCESVWVCVSRCESVWDTWKGRVENLPAVLSSMNGTFSFVLAISQKPSAQTCLKWCTHQHRWVWKSTNTSVTWSGSKVKPGSAEAEPVQHKLTYFFRFCFIWNTQTPILFT